MNNELAVQEKSKSIFDATEFPHWMNVSNQLAKSTMIPKHYMGKPMDILVAVEMGRTVGLSMMQALQNIAVINGKPSIYGDGLPAICMNHSSYEYMNEEPIMEGRNIIGYKCTAKRKFHEPLSRTFTIDDAKKASLWGKQGPWSQYPSRMLQMRARGFALRDAFPDALQGIDIAEEERDLQIIEGSIIKTKQDEKQNELLSKIGKNNEARNADIETNYNVDHTVVDVNTGEIFNPNSSNRNENEKASINSSLPENAESDSSVEIKENENNAPLEQLLDSIECLFDVKGVDKTRRLKALDLFKVTHVNELSYSQAQELIVILNKMENKEQ